MASHNAGRVSEDIKRELAALIRELKDPRISPLLSIVKVQAAPDNSFLRVYVSAMEGMDASVKSVKGLESATGFLKRGLSNHLHLRKAPDLKFVPDNSIEQSAEIQRILEELHEKEEEP